MVRKSVWLVKLLSVLLSEKSVKKKSCSLTAIMSGIVLIISCKRRHSGEQHGARYFRDMSIKSKNKMRALLLRYKL